MWQVFPPEREARAMDSRNLLLEIGTEEIPASFIPPALAALEERCRERLERARLSFGPVAVFGTPRRLCLVVSGVAARQPQREERLVGPPAKVAFGPDGSPTRAALGFARRHGVRVEDVRVEDTPRGPYAVVRKTILGRDAREVLKELLPELVSSIPFPKSMRWEGSGMRFARPIRWIVALYGDGVVPFRLADVSSGSRSFGHRFMAPSPVELKADSAAYLELLEERFVIPDPARRRGIILREAARAAAEAGGRLLEDEELLELNAFLTEYPTAVCGSFPRDFLRLPREVLVTAMKEHQKYFAVVDASGDLLPNFIAINNTRSPREELVKTGHERVLRARLSDAAFFFEEDTRRSLDAYVPELAGVVFHERLGTLLDKTRRIQALAGLLAGILAPEERETACRAALLCKADLLTEMVGEFPGLQGTMGRIYAGLSGEGPEVSRAIEEHYMPVRSGGALPSSVPGAICSIADKLDTICGTFAIGLRPSGTADPYGLRRSSLGILHILEDRSWGISLSSLISRAVGLLPEGLRSREDELVRDVVLFFERRFASDAASRGFQQDVIEAAIRAGFDDPVDCLMRIRALSALRGREEFEPLGLAFKRVMNILKGYEGGDVAPELLEQDEEKALWAAFRALAGKVDAILARGADEERYRQALSAMLSIKPHVDGFFDRVLVMAEDERLRNNRLGLLWQISRLFLRIGDLSAISAAG